MASAAFDALKFVDDLEAVNIPREQARVIVELVRSSHDIADVATKADLTNLEQRLENKFGKLDGKISGIEQSLDAKINSVEQSLNGKIDLLRKDMMGSEQALNARIDLVRRDIEEVRKDMLIKMGGMFIGSVTLILAAIGMAARYLSH